jgi:hypothetical protein
MLLSILILRNILPHIVLKMARHKVSVGPCVSVPRNVRGL